MNLATPINFHTADKVSRLVSEAHGDAQVLLAMRRAIEQAIAKGLNEAEAIAIERLEVLNPDLTIKALREQFAPAVLMDSFVDGFYAARQTLYRVSGECFPEPPVEVEE